MSPHVPSVAAEGRCEHSPGGLLFLFFDHNGFQIVGFEDLPAVQALDVIDTVAPRDDLGPGVLTGGLHTENLWIYSNEGVALVKCPRAGAQGKWGARYNRNEHAFSDPSHAAFARH